MGAQWWSWALTVVGLTGWWLTGRRLWQGWAVSLSVQALWLAYALATGHKAARKELARVSRKTTDANDPAYLEANQRVIDAEKDVPWYRR